MKIRTECPKNNKYYIRTVSGGYNGAVAGQPTISGANVLCNCVGYANGRFNEIGEYGKCKYQLVCNAENFIEAAKKLGLKISSTPIQGGIMVWQKGGTLSGGDGAGHVAVVEEVYEDGSIMTSESGWNAWAFKTIRRNNSNGRWGQGSAYRFRGCIINPAVQNPKVVPTPKLVVDGIGGANTVRAMQKFLGTPQDGVLSGQNKACAKYYPALKAVEYGKGGSTCVKKLQKWLGITADGVWGEKTSKALQKKLGVTADGIFGTNSMKAWQKYLNDNDKATMPVTPTPTPSETEKGVYKFIDVSVWQGNIDWAKVKAAGIDGAIIRYADGTTLDTKFDRNMTEAKKHGLHFGVYIFSRAKTKAEAEDEAKRLFKAAKKFEPDMPYYIDLEDSSLSKYADTVAAAFLNKMAIFGVRGGVYANLNWWNHYLTKTASDYSASAFWIAQYNDTMDYKPASRMGMWQYTSSGKVDGISGKVDRDKCYVAYWTLPPSSKRSVETVAKEVIDGKWSSGDERKTLLTLAGYDYDAVQNKVNEILTGGGAKLGAKANELAYTTNTSKAKYPDGKPTAAFKAALSKVYPDRSKWGKAPKVGASCDVFVGTCVRSAGIDSKFPRGLGEQWKRLAKSDKFELVKNPSKDTLRDGDIITYERTKAGTGHICIFFDGKIKEASYENCYGKTTNTVSSRLSTKGKRWVKVYRAKGASSWVERANAWARMIAGIDSLHYMKWVAKDDTTHTDPIKTKRVVIDATYDAVKKVFKLISVKINCAAKYAGWNCIGLLFAILHWGGGIPCKVGCGVISNAVGEQILFAKTDAEALRIVQEKTGVKEWEVIRNVNGIPKSKWKAGDGCLKFNGNTYKHMFYYMGNGEVCDASDYSDNKKDIAVRSYTNYTAKVILRYIGK